MAGRDASANLGGMLSQIGGAIGGMSEAGTGLMRPIATAFRPQLDLTDAESLRRQAAFQGRIGDTEQQRLFTIQAETVAEKQKAEQAKEGQAAIGRILNKNVKDVLQDQTLSPEQRDAKLAELQRTIDQTAETYNLPVLNTADSVTKAQQTYTAGILQRNAMADRQAERDALAEAERERNMLRAFTSSISGLTDVNRINELAGQVPENISYEARQRADYFIDSIQQKEDRRLREAAVKAPVAKLEAAKLMPESKAVPEETQAYVQGLIDDFNEKADAINKKLESGQLEYAGQKNGLIQAREALAVKISGIYLSNIDDAANEARATRKVINNRLGIISTKPYSDNLIKDTQDIPGTIRGLSKEEAIRRLRNLDLINLYAAFGQDVPADKVFYNKGDDPYVLAGLPKPGDKKPAINPEDVTVESEAPVTNRAEERNAREEALLAERRNIIGGDRKRRRTPEAQQRLTEINAELESLTSGLSMPQANFYGGALANDPFLKQFGTQSNLGMGPANFYGNALANDPALNPQIRGRGQRRQ